MATLIAYQACLDIGKYPQVWQDHVKAAYHHGRSAGHHHAQVGSEGVFPPVPGPRPKARRVVGEQAFLEMLPQNVSTGPPSG